MVYKRTVQRSRGDRIFDVVNTLIMLGIIVVVIFPVLNVIAISFSNAEHVARADVTIFPKGFNVEAYSYILRDPQVWRGYLNSIGYCVGFTLCNLLFTSLFAYPLTHDDFLGKKFCTIFLTITMFFGGGMIPTYLLMRNLHLIDNPLVLIIPGCVGAYNVFVFRTFFNNIPSELSESAKMDGANDFTILFRIVLPLSKALLATFGLFAIVGMWNNWFSALLYLNDTNKYPVQMILRQYLYVLDTVNMQQRAGMGGGYINPTLLQQISPKGVRMAMVVVTMFPIMMIYPFFQKYFVKGVMIGAVKG
ncbi:MAG: carbohydrate ABC transporter permease [Lachnospiraceae bacterium]|jgi:putative aldouronate transport system permease protein|nr:carbohydrate ABC transporter permease [uncultured Acetatifactor sp.]MCI9218608.1 carbohydrate ABC transporter permease [Lachnospiraceae bacterium]